MSSTKSLSDAFAEMWFNDADFQRIERGTLRWVDVSDPVWEAERATRAAQRAAAMAVAASAVEDPVEVPLKPEPAPAFTAPAYTVGIKTLITRNLPRTITVEQLRGVFEKYGPICDIYIPKNADKSSPHYGTIKGFALIKYLKPTDSARAYEEQYGRLTLGSKNITVEFAKADR
jgi:hypothetical protein